MRARLRWRSKSTVWNEWSSVLDAALSLEQHIDIDKGLRRPRYPETIAGTRPAGER